MNPTRIHEEAGLIPGLAQWAKGSSLAVSCGGVCRHVLDPALLWLWYKLAAAASIQALAWELPYAACTVQKDKKKKKKPKTKTKNPPKHTVTYTTSHPLERLLLKKETNQQKIKNVGKDVAKLKFLGTVCRNVKLCSCYGKQRDGSSKIKNRISM